LSVLPAFLLTLSIPVIVIFGLSLVFFKSLPDVKKITDAEKKQFIDEISNVIGILEAEGGRDEEVQKLQAA